jgi:hypothetical protein
MAACRNAWLAGRSQNALLDRDSARGLPWTHIGSSHSLGPWSVMQAALREGAATSRGLWPTSRSRAARPRVSISSSWFGSGLWGEAKAQSRSLASMMRGQPIRVRFGWPSCLREIAVFGSILRRFVQSFERVRSRGTASGDRRGGNRIAGFLQNALILPAEGPGRSANDA